MSKEAVILVGHGSRQEEANEVLFRIARQLPAFLPGVTLRPAFFSLAKPDLAETAGDLYASGTRRILLVPFFLVPGTHLKHDIPDLLDKMCAGCPGLEVRMLPPLGDSPGLLTVLRDKILEELLMAEEREDLLPGEIEKKSFSYIEGFLESLALPGDRRAVIRRVIHATADFDFARTLLFSENAVSRGREALKKGALIITDVQMVKAGLAAPPERILTIIDDPRVAEKASREGTTRAAASMELLRDSMEGAVVAIGNAPTALFKVLEFIREGLRPALVVGLPVGFVGAARSKRELAASGAEYITNIGPRGGSPLAAAAVNALLKDTP
jgi:precorrin-8X/cobalt-precorrin-8 methylmutase